MSEHTKTPWHIAGKATIKHGKTEWIGSVSWQNRPANAEFIVRACNAHDDLVAALKAAITELDEWCQKVHGDGYNNPRFNEILNRAEGMS